MWPELWIRRSQLRVLSSIFSDISAGLLLLTLGVREFPVVAAELTLAVLFALTAVRIEDILEEL